MMATELRTELVKNSTVTKALSLIKSAAFAGAQWKDFRIEETLDTSKPTYLNAVQVYMLKELGYKVESFVGERSIRYYRVTGWLDKE